MRYADRASPDRKPRRPAAEPDAPARDTEQPIAGSLVDVSPRGAARGALLQMMRAQRTQGAVIQRVPEDDLPRLRSRFQAWEDRFRANGLVDYWMYHSPLRVWNEAQRRETLQEAIGYMDAMLNDMFARALQEARQPPAAATAAPPPPAAAAPPPGRSFGMNEDEKAEYLRQLDASARDAPRGPLGPPRVTLAPDNLQRPPRGATHSRQVEGHNNDCVIAAFRTARPGEIRDRQLANAMTSTEQGIAQVAAAYGMGRIDPTTLPDLLARGGRAFINVPALGGGGYHAYTAIGMDPQTGKIIAWDTDSDHRDIKLVPVELVWLAYA